MDKKLNLGEKLDFSDIDLTAPQKVIEEMNEILPHAKAAYDEYAKWYVEFDNRKRLLVSYAMQGVIKKEDIPVFYKKSLIDYLYEYRAQRKKNKKS